MTNRAATAHRLYYTSVYRFVRRRTRSREDAEDLTQTVFSEAVLGLEQMGAEPRSMLAWLYTVAARRLIDEQRRKRSGPAQVISLEAARLKQQPGDDYGADVARTLARAIASLPADQQRVVVLKLIEGRRFAEVVQEVGVSEQACRARLSRALRTLRNHLEQEGVTP